MASSAQSLETRKSSPGNILRPLALLAIILAVSLFLKWSFDFMQNETTPKGLALVAALVTGVAGTWSLFWIMDSLISYLPSRRLREGMQPLIFIGPALVLLGVYLIYPTLHTIVISFFDARSVEFVGLENYLTLFAAKEMHVAFRNNLVWLVVVTFSCVSLGLVIAVLVDRIKHESIAKSMIFLPVAISSVGASVIWRFMYAFQPIQRPQIGLLNALLVALGGEPTGWLLKAPWNTFALMVIMIWMQTGFCMVVLSAAIKNVPSELMEAARIDGANEFQLFFGITIPYIRGTLITISTTILIMVLKIFDIVYVMTRGHYNTEVIANRMYIEMFSFRNFGNGSALAVILFLAVVPAMIFNIYNLRRQRS